MTPWRWWAGELDEDVYDLVEDCATREEVIQAASRQLSPGDQFRIVEARASEDRRYEGSDFVPFLRTRNKEVITVGPVLAATEGSADE